MKHLVTLAERKGCHGGETKMVPRQHSGPGNSSEIPMQTRSVRMCGTRKRWGVIPDTGCPTRRRHGKRGTCNDLSRTRCKHGISYNKAFIHGRDHLEIIPLKCAFWGESSSVRCRGSSRSRVVVGSSCSRGDSSGSSRTRRWR